jgi:hypothetical protein
MSNKVEMSDEVNVKSFFYSTLAIKKVVFKSSESSIRRTKFEECQTMLNDVEVSEDIGEV